MSSAFDLVLQIFLTLAYAGALKGQPLFPADIFESLNVTNLTAGCRSDVTLFSTSLSTFATTFAACRQNGSCTKEQQKTLDENVYAVQQFDAFGKIPAGLLQLTVINTGSYSECMRVEAPYKVHYCYVNAEINANDTSKVKSKLAVCIPTSCTEKDTVELMNSLNTQELVPINFTGTSCVPTEKIYPTSFWVFMSFMAFFVSWAIIATGVDYVWCNYYKDRQQNSAVRILLTFSVYSNGSLLMDVSTPKKGTLKSLASIRFITMTWVAASHTIQQDASSDTLAPVQNMWNPLLSTTITNGFLSVDTFFVVSGVLVSYTFFKTRPTAKRIKNPFFWVSYYVHRYIRLTPPVMIFLWFYVIMKQYINGPWAQSLIPLWDNPANTCEKYWWRNLLYINNFFDYAETCYIPTWYLAVDTQLYLVAPVFLIVLFISPLAGLLLLFGCVAASVGSVYAITIKNSFPALVSGVFIRMAEGYPDYWTFYYQKPWNRCPPYLIGMAVGYLLALGKKPRMSIHLISLNWILLAAIALACVYGPHDYIKGDENWNIVVAGTYNNFSRIGWTLAVCWVIVANHWGWGGLIAKFMDHPLWQPLGRLSYCGYIVHWFLINYVNNLDDRPAHHISMWRTYLCLVIPVIVVSYVFAFFWSCLFEMPTVKLEKMLTAGLLPKRSVESPKSVAGADLRQETHVKIAEFKSEEKNDETTTVTRV